MARAFRPFRKALPPRWTSSLQATAWAFTGELGTTDVGGEAELGGGSGPRGEGDRAHAGGEVGHRESHGCELGGLNDATAWVIREFCRGAAYSWP